MRLGAAEVFIRVKYHCTISMVKAGEDRVKYIPTSDMIADILTKALPKDQFDYLSAMILNSTM